MNEKVSFLLDVLDRRGVIVLVVCLTAIAICSMLNRRYCFHDNMHLVLDTKTGRCSWANDCEKIFKERKVVKSELPSINEPNGGKGVELPSIHDFNGGKGVKGFDELPSIHDLNAELANRKLLQD